MPALPPFRLQPKFEGRTWGREDLSPWYPTAPPHQDGEPIGEAWLTGPQCIALDGPCKGETLATIAKDHAQQLLGPSHCNDAEFPLLAKLLFPDAKLSVQVHPNDEEARALGIQRGKTECWYILAAQPGATVACGLQPGVTIPQLRAAIANGTAEDLLLHLPVTTGDMVFVDAGTVHAIGPGVTILEVQQTCDTTYRLFDYGRPRELHLEQGLAVSKLTTRAGKVPPQPIQLGDKRGTRLIAEQYFTVDTFPLQTGDTLHISGDTPRLSPLSGDTPRLSATEGQPACLIALQGDAEISFEETTTPLPAGTALILPANSPAITIKATQTLQLLRATP